MFRGTLADQLFADRPPAVASSVAQDEYVEHLAELLAAHADELAAVIVEPVVQGAGGMWFYSPEILRTLRRLCDEHRVLLIFDEIATGFGRTGELFAAHHARAAPDVMCVGKALTGGYLSLAATLCRPEVSQGVAACESGALMHGPTFMANPLACAAALASLELLAGGRWRTDVARIECQLRSRLEPARQWPWVADVRVLGAIGVIELTGEVDLPAATFAAVNQGAWLMPFGKLIYAMPPFVITDGELGRVIDALLAAASTGDSNVA